MFKIAECIGFTIDYDKFPLEPKKRKWVGFPHSPLDNMKIIFSVTTYSQGPEIKSETGIPTLIEEGYIRTAADTLKMRC